MLFAPARHVYFSLAALLLAGSAFAQTLPANPNAPGRTGTPGTQTPRPGTPATLPQGNPVPRRMMFGTFDPTRAINYGTYRPGRSVNGNRQYNQPQSPFTTNQPRYRSFFRNYNYSNYVYTNGLFTNGIFTYDWAYAIFPGGNAAYPYYVPDFVPGGTYFSPYSYYSQSAPSFILADTVYQAPPQVIYVPVPVYMNGDYRGVQKAEIDDYYLNRTPKQDDGPKVGANGAAGSPRTPANAPQTDRLIARAAADIAKAWQTGSMDALAPYIDAKAQIAIYLRGKYQYSLDARDYLDLTRDAFAATKTVKFELDAPVRKERGVYLLTGRHVYQNKDGAERTVYVNYALELKEDKYQITQVGSAPDKVEEYKIGE